MTTIIKQVRSTCILWSLVGKFEFPLNKFESSLSGFESPLTSRIFESLKMDSTHASLFTLNKIKISAQQIQVLIR